MDVRRIDAVVVGAGFAGLYMLHRLRGLGLEVCAIEAGSGVGGTWYWNRYPGARCDIESMEYSYQFSDALAQEWEWSERYATQPEILRYANHVADRFDLKNDIEFETRIVSAHYSDDDDDEAKRWRITTDRGDIFMARWCVMATGCLSSANLPDIPGRDRFAGGAYHTGRWPHQGVDFHGKRVAVIGTGSSGIQSIPLIAEQASQLFVFQRTPTYSVPAHNRPLDPNEVCGIKADYRNFRARNAEQPFGFGAQIGRGGQSALAVGEADRASQYADRWHLGGLPFLIAFSDLMLDPEANETAAEFIRAKISAIVADPAVAERLTPRQVVGCKRLCVDTNYYATYNRDNVTLVDLRDEAIQSIDAAGIRTTEKHYPLDAIVFATGFDAMTGALERIDIRGRGDRALKEKWSAGPRAYLGLATAGFPNLFLVTGPGSPSVLSNMLPSIEQHVDWIARCLQYMQQQQIEIAEARSDAENEWVAHVNEVADKTLFPTTASWYTGANVPGKPRVFLPYVGGLGNYTVICDKVAADGYRGIQLDPARQSATSAASA